VEKLRVQARDNAMKTGLSMYEMIRKALTDRKGVTAMEYAVIAAGIVIVVAAAASAAGDSIEGLFNQIQGYLNPS
jgi:Flp pilus assembly pilin Flp